MDKLRCDYRVVFMLFRFRYCYYTVGLFAIGTQSFDELKSMCFSCKWVLHIHAWVFIDRYLVLL